MKRKIYINKTLIFLMAFNIIQAISIIGILFFNYLKNNKSLHGYIDKEHILLLLILLAILVNSILTIKDVQTATENYYENDTLRDTLRQVENLNNILRAQRHDFMNHLQVVHGLMDMEEFQESKNYIEKVFEDIQKINYFLKTANPAVNALLQAKILNAEKKNIKVVLNIKSNFRDIKIPSWELCRVLGNIIDNSIYALKNVTCDKFIEVSLFENLKTYGFKIVNNGPKISDEIINEIFDAGFTTKNAEGEGMGLFICKNILSKYNGGIQAKSGDEKTEFIGWFEK